MAYVLSRVNYKNLYKGLNLAKEFPKETHTIVLFSYIHSSVYDTIAQMERIPETTQFLHTFLARSDVNLNLLKLFAMDRNSKLYTRRHIDHTREGVDSLTKFRELVLQIDPEDDIPTLPSSISEEDDDEMPPLYDANGVVM